MSRRKTLARLLAGARSVPFDDFRRLVEAFGFQHRRTSGSHHIYRHPDVPRPRSLQPKGGEAKRYWMRQFLEMVEEHGLRMERGQ